MNEIPSENTSGNSSDNLVDVRVGSATMPTGLPVPPEPSSFRLIATLGLAGFISGVALVGVYMLTLPTIERNRREALERAILQVLPGAVTYKTLASRDGRLVFLGDKKSGQDEGALIYAGYDAQDGLVGFAIPGSEPGYQDQIHGILGYDPRRKAVVGFHVLESRETPGLGDKIMKDATFRANFKHLAVVPSIEAVPSGKKTRPNQVETITGATISSKTVVRLLQKSLATWRARIATFLANRSDGSLRRPSSRLGHSRGGHDGSGQSGNGSENQRESAHRKSTWGGSVTRPVCAQMSLAPLHRPRAPTWVVPSVARFVELTGLRGSR
jgi:H+/Na+-translocating ferredoxin:NAD+ oxidoreductase subunit G